MFVAIVTIFPSTLISLTSVCTVVSLLVATLSNKAINLLHDYYQCSYFSPSPKTTFPMWPQFLGKYGGLIREGQSGTTVFSVSPCPQDGSEVKLQKAQITLNDCLACSGCITSAESVLITQQSQEELYRVLEENRKLRQVHFLA